MRTPSHACARFTRRYLASSGVVVLLVGVSLSAQAQFFSSSGANGSFPTNLFPIDPFAQTLDFTGNTVSIGGGAVGSFAGMSGATFKANGLTIGDGGTGTGTVTFSGFGTTALMGGLGVGGWGTGSLTVSAGALLDASQCLAFGTSCFSAIGNGAGSTGTLTVTGAGSQASFTRLNVGQAAVFTQATDGFTFGTPGGTTNAFVNVTNGGTINSQRVVVGQGPTQAAAAGAQAFGTVVIDGPGSKWMATRDTINNGAAFFGVGSNPGGHGLVTVQNGGQ